MKKRAFTLTELLVVVVIIGTLAAVVLPKFTKVLETRKTTEAEDIMQAIRTEQEARCTLDKKYATTFDELAAGPTSTSSNYTYALANAGVSAASNSKGYTLRILSYANGGICCEGDYCSKLNKSYPSCGAYVPNEADNACLPEGVEPEPEPEPEPCTLTPKTKTLTCQEAGHPAGYTGSVTQTVDEETCQYVTTSDTCAKEDTTCHPDKGQSYYEECPEDSYNYQGRVVYTWNQSKCAYDKDESDCGCAPTNAGKERYDGDPCPSERPSGKIEFVWNYSKCQYEMKDLCYCDDQARQSCEEKGTWDDRECTCVCPSGTTWDGYECKSPNSSCDEQEKEACERSHNLWEPQHCECLYCDGLRKNEYDALVESCEQPMPNSHYEMGTWNDQKCWCDCDATLHRYPTEDHMNCEEYRNQGGEDDCWGPSGSGQNCEGIGDDWRD